MVLNQLPKWATSFKYKKNNAYIMGLCLTYRVNLKLSLRQTVQALKEIHNIDVSHTMVNNYAKTAAVIIRPSFLILLHSQFHPPFPSLF